jgi:2'-5' RNA ligase
MRVFIALDVSPSVLAELERVQERLKAVSEARRWEPRRNSHLTLHFLGELEERQLEPLREMIARTVAGMAPFELRLGGLGGFPRLAKARVLFVDVVGDLQRLARLHHALGQGLETLGCTIDERVYHPHLTLCREPRDLAAVQALAPALEVEGVAWPVDRVTLYQSTLTPQGAIYTPLGRYPLAAAVGA